MNIFRSQKAGIVLFLAAAVLIAIAIVVIRGSGVSDEAGCTLEAKICPDGTAVGRMGPSCEFAPCPTLEVNEGLLETQDTESGVYYFYPEALPTFYSEAVDWPPILRINDGPFLCTEAGNELARAGKTSLQTVGQNTYCVTEIIEGAAGSTYAQYAYAFPYKEKVAIFTFSMRYVQCANYEAAQQQACEAERSAFDLLAIVDQMAQSLHTEH
jgi:hypothetical protein